MVLTQTVLSFFSSYIGIALGVFVCLALGYGVHRFIRRYRMAQLIRLQDPLTVGIIPAEELAVAPEIGKSFTGFMTDVMSELGARMGRKVALQPAAADSYANELNNKEIDIMILDGTTAVSRAADVDIIPCHTTALSSLALVFWDKMPHHVQSLHDFAYYPYNSTVVVRNSMEEHYLSMFDTIRMQRVDSATNLIIQLKLGLVRAGLMRIEHVHCLKREYSNLKYVPISLQKRCVIQDERLGIARGNQDLMVDVEHYLAQMRRDHTMRHLHDKWFGQ